MWGSRNNSNGLARLCRLLNGLMLLQSTHSFLLQHPSRQQQPTTVSTTNQNARILSLTTRATMTTTRSRVRMAMDPVTYLRTEWISAALCTNQTPRSADVCLQIGTQDGRAVSFIPRTIRELITSSAEPDGKLTVQARRQLKQSQERRGAAVVKYVDQPADDLRETPNESVDVVISFQAAELMVENGLDWKKSVREAARVLKPGGRLLWVEPTTIQGESYIDYLESLVDLPEQLDVEGGEEIDDITPYLVFDDTGYDDVDLVLIPHTAGVAVKNPNAGMTPAQRMKMIRDEEEAKLADLSIAAYERGLKKKRKKRKKQSVDDMKGMDKK